jgi:SAM-dependent methyltransferase
MLAGVSVERPLPHMWRRVAKKILPRPIVRWIQRIKDTPEHEIPLGAVRFGDLRRLSPICNDFGWSRGTPIDRYYIDRFLAQNASDVRGHVLELDDAVYARAFGQERVERIDVLSVESTNPRATIIGDLTQADTLPTEGFNCIILTQTLQYIFDLPAAIATLYRALKRGGILLITAPGVTPIEQSWPWYWTFTTATMCRLLEDRFGQDAVTVEAHGNVFTATAFLHGLAIEELRASEFNVDDKRYPLIVTARAIKGLES